MIRGDKYRNCKDCEAYQKIEEIKNRIAKVPKLASSGDYKLCIDDINTIALRNKEEPEKVKSETKDILADEEGRIPK